MEEDTVLVAVPAEVQRLARALPAFV